MCLRGHLRATRAFRFERSTLELFLDVFNVYDRTNLRGYEWFLEDQGGILSVELQIQQGNFNSASFLIEFRIGVHAIKHLQRFVVLSATSENSRRSLQSGEIFGTAGIGL